MNLRKYKGRKVHILDYDGEEFVGVASDYIWEDDNEKYGCDGLIIDNPEYDNPILINSKDIQSIDILE